MSRSDGIALYFSRAPLPWDRDGFAAVVEGGHAVAVSTVITPDLEAEGLAREVVRRLQDMRREAGFDLSDRITTWYAGSPAVDEVMVSHGGYIGAETLSTELVPGEPPAYAHREEHDLEGTKVTLGVRRNV